MTKPSNRYLRRYTDLTALLHILQSRSISLLDPNHWEDKNDSEFMRIFKNGSTLTSLVALCFTQAGETYHHWKVFAKGMSGVCIYFNKEKLISQLAQQNVVGDAVNYFTLQGLKSASLSLAELPFSKRYQFRDEKEFRLIYACEHEQFTVKSFAIELDCIERIALSPWLAPALADSIKQTIRAIAGCEKMRVVVTNLNQNQAWIEHGLKAC